MTRFTLDQLARAWDAEVDYSVKQGWNPFKNMNKADISPTFMRISRRLKRQAARKKRRKGK